MLLSWADERYWSATVRGTRRQARSRRGAIPTPPPWTGFFRPRDQGRAGWGWPCQRHRRKSEEQTDYRRPRRSVDAAWGRRGKARVIAYMKPIWSIGHARARKPPLHLKRLPRFVRALHQASAHHRSSTATAWDDSTAMLTSPLPEVWWRSYRSWHVSGERMFYPGVLPLPYHRHLSESGRCNVMNLNLNCGHGIWWSHPALRRRLIVSASVKWPTKEFLCFDKTSYFPQ